MVGFRIQTQIPKADPAMAATLGQLGTPLLSDGMKGFNVMDSGIRPIADGIRIAGSAVTLRLRPGDNLLLHKSVGLIGDGDVLVIDTCGCTTHSVMGELIATAAFSTGLAGIVVDGGVRDIRELKENGFPIFARFISPAVGDKDGPGEINYPICCGGVPVHPGDIIVGDENGIVVIPPRDAPAILAGAEKKLAYEDKRRQAIRDGVLVGPQIDQKLREQGVLA